MRNCDAVLAQSSNGMQFASFRTGVEVKEPSWMSCCHFVVPGPLLGATQVGELLGHSPGLLLGVTQPGLLLGAVLGLHLGASLGLSWPFHRSVGNCCKECCPICTRHSSRATSHQTVCHASECSKEEGLSTDCGSINNDGWLLRSSAHKFCNILCTKPTSNIKVSNLCTCRIHSTRE